MGTNYYLKTGLCPHCGKGVERLHIGKSSGGWCFSLHVIPEEGINDLDDWKKKWRDGGIEDEYGQVTVPRLMELIITDRDYGDRWSKKWWFPFHKSEADFHKQNGSERGPKGLLRAKIDGSHCIKHGKGTWDCIVGEFS